MKRLTTAMLTVALLAGGCVRPEEKTVQGTIEILPKKLDGTWIVSSGGCQGKRDLITVTPETRIEPGGAATAGAFVEISGHADGRYLHAGNIKIHPPVQ